MGLDMYLSQKHYVSGYNHAPAEEKALYNSVVSLFKAAPSAQTPSCEVSINVAYWRKANAIHAWFVKHCQDGIDECQDAEVSRKQLTELRDLCKALLSTRSKKDVELLLPPQEGFFFGNTDIDENYWQDLDDTVKQLTDVLDGSDIDYFTYHASW